mmetsp:Transcript_24409/g.39707  ORF Transcript_24409/g.39707 Transcript_24409/m.39707 type:complete len:298 (+) Transcript_24409:108-1001(+)
MTSSQSYSDFEREYNTHLSKVRSFLAQPTANSNNATSLSSSSSSLSLSSCEQALQDAKRCIHAMRGLAEIEGDPFKAQEAKRKLERDIGPLEQEMKGRVTRNSKRSVAAGNAIGSSSGSSGIGGGISSVFGGRNTNNTTTTTGNNDERYLFGNRNSYAAPSAPTTSTMGGDFNDDYDDGNDLEHGGEGSSSLTTPLTATTERRMRDSQHLLRETQALCAESEQLGASTLETMGRQREQMERGGGLLESALEDTAQARAIMKEMTRRALKNKIVLYCIIALLVLANGSAIVHLWRRKK